MKLSTLRKSLLACLLAPVMANAAYIEATVTTTADSGPGSLRAALASGANTIGFAKGVGDITIISKLVYDGTDPLTIKGKGQTIIGHGNSGPILYVSEGADLFVEKLKFQGLGGYSINNPGGGKGIYVKVPLDREGMVSVQLTNVSLIDTGKHGLHVSDCSLGNDCGAGQGVDAGEGSDASIFVQLTRVKVDGAGFGEQDADGVRIDERGRGDIIFNASGSLFRDVGGDGVELDEGGPGDVIIGVRNSRFVSNGAYCADTDDGGPFDPIAIDPNCNDDGDPDVDDAFDIDESGSGGIIGVVANVLVKDNYDEGLDFDTEGDTGVNIVNLDLMQVVGSGNADEAIKVSEEGKATVKVNMVGVDVAGDVEVEEENDGDLQVWMSYSSVGDDLKLSESDAGQGAVKLTDTTVGDKKDFVDVVEQ